MDENNVPGANDAGKAAEESPPKGPEKLSPHEWAERHSLVFKPNQRISNALKGAKSTAGTNMPQTEGRKHWKLAAADTLFGWSEHSYHFEQDPKAPKFTLTEEEFRDALEAAAAFPCLELPLAAIPESQRERLEKYLAKDDDAEAPAKADANTNAHDEEA